MCPQTKGQRGPQQNCRKRIHRKGTRSRHNLCLNPNFWDTSNPFDNRLDEAMDCESWRHFGRFLTRPCGQRQSVHVAISGLYPSGYYTTTIWKLKKALYGLRSSPKACQDFFADVLQQLHLTRLVSEPNAFTNKERTVFVLVYVDDLLFLGKPQGVDAIFQAIQQPVLLRHTGTLGVGQTVHFLGREIANNGDHHEISLKPQYTGELLKESGMDNSNPVTTPGTAGLKQATNDEMPLTQRKSMPTTEEQ